MQMEAKYKPNYKKRWEKKNMLKARRKRKDKINTAAVQSPHEPISGQVFHYWSFETRSPSHSTFRSHSHAMTRIDSEYPGGVCCVAGAHRRRRCCYQDHLLALLIHLRWRQP